MKRIAQIALLSGMALLSSCGEAEKEITVEGMRCEGLVNPVGIDNPAPRLSWRMFSEDREVMQSACRVLVASSPALLEKDSADLWDSGKITDRDQPWVDYKGREPETHERLYWKVKLWAGDDTSPWSEVQRWTMGMRYHNQWSGRWIGFDRAFPWDREEMHSILSARYFRKEFNTPEGKEIKEATLYIMGLGLYELYLNGKKAGKQVLSPAPTNYTRRVFYNSFDVSGDLETGTNALGVVLGNGRYHSMRQHYKPYKIMNFGYPKLLLNLHIRYTDGSSEIIRTDDSWKGTADGPIRSNNEYDGEIYDARKEFGSWTLPGFDDSNWLKAEYVQEPGGNYESQPNENMAVMDTLLPVSINRLGPVKWILDMGQNMTGWMKMRVRGPRGTFVQMRFAESLREDGSLFTDNLRDALNTDLYILRGGGEEYWQPSFVYHGFRYVEISGYPGTPAPEDFKGLVIYDALPGTGRFHSSDSLLNRLHEAARWSVAGNYKGMPVDCPQRNERQPWLGDRTQVCQGESFLFDNARHYAKWLDDIRLTQRADGSIADVAPAYFRYYSDNMSWPGTYLTVAEMLYRQYGDIRSVEKHYPHMKRWLDYMKARYEKDGIMTRDRYGDWCVPPVSIEAGRGKSADVKRPHALISTAYYYYFLGLMQEFAVLAGREVDIPAFREEAEKVYAAFNREYFPEEAGGYGNDDLTHNILALAFGLVPEDKKARILSRVEGIIRDYGTHLSSGVVGVQWLMRTLARNGLEDLALELATQTTYPSWGYMLENGATTIWELWNGNTAAPSMNSQNHVMMLGDLLTWYYEDLAGIRSHPDHPGFGKILMNPTFPEGLKHVNASYYSIRGEIRSSWTVSGDSLTWQIRIPANTRAEIHLPESEADNLIEVGSGEYQFKFVNP